MKTIHLGELCERMGYKPRYARYILERHDLPGGFPHPGQGNYREFDFNQAMWLAIVLVLQRQGLKTGRAVGMASQVMRLISPRGYVPRGNYPLVADPAVMIRINLRQVAKKFSDIIPDR
jgi:hypothetical protein